MSMFFKIRLVLRTPQGESTHDIAAAIEKAIREHVLKGFTIVFLVVETGEFKEDTTT